MGPLETRIKIAIFIIAVLFTAGLGYMATGGMHWVFEYIGSFGQSGPHPTLRIVGAAVIAFIVILRFYFRHRAKQARKRK
jgi:uncharacterized membrane protein